MQPRAHLLADPCTVKSKTNTKRTKLLNTATRNGRHETENKQEGMTNSSSAKRDHERHTTRIFIIPPSSFTLADTGPARARVAFIRCRRPSASDPPCVCGRRARAAWPVCRAVRPSVRRVGDLSLENTFDEK